MPRNGTWNHRWFVRYGQYGQLAEYNTEKDAWEIYKQDRNREDCEVTYGEMYIFVPREKKNG